MTAPSLTDFLRARLADQIATARAVQSQGVTDSLDPSDPRSAALRLARSAIADCEAKRRVVADYLTFQRVSDERAEGTPLPQALTAAGLARGLWHAMQILALPYADHEDYEEGWRP